MRISIQSSEAIIQAQVEAYNAHDIDAFMALHSPTAKLYNLVTGELILEDEAAIRERYTNCFTNPELHAEITNRMVIGNRVIDHERVRGIDPDRVVEVVAIYEVEDGLIQRVWFIYN